MFVKHLTLCCVLLASIRVAAGDDAAWHAHGDIRGVAERALQAVIDSSLPGVELEPVMLDSRLRLARCQSKLDAFVASPKSNQSRVPVRVSCASPTWTLHVPVDIRRRHTVLVLRRAVARGESLSAADVNPQTRLLPGLGSPFVATAAELAGRLTRRPLPEGTAVPADALSVALLIHRGQAVTLVAQADGFEIRAPGRALSDGAAHQRVRAQNLHSLKIVEGVADKGSVVRVPP